MSDCTPENLEYSNLSLTTSKKATFPSSPTRCVHVTPLTSCNYAQFLTQATAVHVNMTTERPYQFSSATVDAPSTNRMGPDQRRKDAPSIALQTHSAQ